MKLELSTTKSVFNIQAGRPFLETLAKGICHSVTENGTPLSDFTILLPTRRSLGGLRDAFLKANDRKPLLLPYMVPMGDLDEEDMMLSGWEDSEMSDLIGISPAISATHRQLLLTKLVQAFEKESTSIDQAAQLAKILGHLLDQIQTERIPFDGLEKLVPADYSEHWQVTLKFLEILTKHWPVILKDLDLLDPADRRNKLLESRVQLWKLIPPKGYIIAAGSTGSIPATRDLLNLVAQIPNGCIVLPGLDQTLSSGDINSLEVTHPQYGMVQLLSKLEISLQDVKPWEYPGQPNTDSAREELINKALRPASSFENVHPIKPPPLQKLEDVGYVECPGPEDEAGVIALMMRKTLETKDKTAALVTSDRGLARRVASQLRRWTIDIDDSAGQKLSNTPPGIFLRLTAELVKNQFEPVDLLATCKNSLAACGFAPVKFHPLIRQLELTVLRGPRPSPGIDGLLAIVPAEHTEFIKLLKFIDLISTNLSKLVKKHDVSLKSLLEAHISFAENFAATDTEKGSERLWESNAGGVASAFVSELLENSSTIDHLSGKYYPSLLTVLMSDWMVRKPQTSQPRLQIWGPLEARLQRADLVILAGLNEGSWPPETHADPWMSRPMRSKFGLPLPERRIGLSAHDFSQNFCAPEVILTRSRRVDGAPTVPARWLLRLGHIIGGLETILSTSPNHHWYSWHLLLDKPKLISPVGPPAPSPPLSARPRKLSVTQVETLMRDPYTIYARHILRLTPLPTIDSPPDATIYGSIIHQILDQFIKKFPAKNSKPLPQNAEQILIKMGEKAFETVKNYPSVWAFWWPRFVRIARWFINREREDRKIISEIRTEVRGSIEIATAGGIFTLSAVADRIDKLLDGTIRITDYKTGAPPSKKEIHAGFAPQLPLEATIANLNGFQDIYKGSAIKLNYWRLHGGTPPGIVSSPGDNPEKLAIDAIEGLTNLINAFDSDNTPYESRPRPETAPKYSDYEHLARIKEWAVLNKPDDT